MTLCWLAIISRKFSMLKFIFITHLVSKISVLFVISWDLISRSPSGIVLNQWKYCLDLLYESGLLACKPASSSMEPSYPLFKSEGSSLLNPSEYRRLSRCLLYLTHTKPDISFAAHKLNQFISIHENLI